MPIACWNTISAAATARRYWIVTTVSTGRVWLSDSGTAGRSAKSGRQQVELGGVRAARLRLDVPHRRVVALQFRQQLRFDAALQHLGEEAAAGTQHFACELNAGFHKGHDLELIGFLVAGGVRRHVGHHHVRPAAQHLLKCSGRLRIEEIDLAKRNAGNGRQLKNVDRHDLAPALRGADTLGRDLAPAAWCGAEVNNTSAGFQQAIFVVDLDQLVGGARTHALALGARHIWIVKLALKPALLRHGAVLPGLQPHLERTLTHDAWPWLDAQTLSARIISTSMPSRRPRSATRRRVQGKTRRIASTMAQPASTRSARSAPMHGLATRSS